MRCKAGRGADHRTVAHVPAGLAGLARRPKAAKECVAKPRPGRLFKPHEHGNCSIARGRGTGVRRGPRRRADRGAADRHNGRRRATPIFTRSRGPTAARCRPTSPARTSTFICRTGSSGSSRCSIRAPIPKATSSASSAMPQAAAARATFSTRCTSATRSRSARRATIFRWWKMPSTSCCSPAASASRRSGAWRSSSTRAEPLVEALLFLPLARRHGVSPTIEKFGPDRAHLHFDDESEGAISRPRRRHRQGAGRTRIFIAAGPTRCSRPSRPPPRAGRARNVHVEYFTPKSRGGDVGRLLGRARALRRRIFHPRGQEDSRSAATKPASTSTIPASSASAASA